MTRLRIHHLQFACIRMWIWQRLAPRASSPGHSPAATALECARVSFSHPKDFVLTSQDCPLTCIWLVFISSIFVVIRSSSSLLPAPRFPRSDELRVWAAVIPRCTSGPFLPYRSPCPGCLRLCGCFMVQGVDRLDDSVPGRCPYIPSALAPAAPAPSPAAPKKKTVDVVSSAMPAHPPGSYMEAQGWGLPVLCDEHDEHDEYRYPHHACPHPPRLRGRAPSSAMGGVFAFVRGSSPALSFLRRPTTGREHFRSTSYDHSHTHSISHAQPLTTMDKSRLGRRPPAHDHGTRQRNGGVEDGEDHERGKGKGWLHAEREAESVLGHRRAFGVLSPLKLDPRGSRAVRLCVSAACYWQRVRLWATTCTALLAGRVHGASWDWASVRVVTVRCGCVRGYCSSQARESLAVVGSGGKEGFCPEVSRMRAVNLGAERVPGWMPLGVLSLFELAPCFCLSAARWQRVCPRTNLHASIVDGGGCALHLGMGRVMRSDRTRLGGALRGVLGLLDARTSVWSPRLRECTWCGYLAACFGAVPPGHAGGDSSGLELRDRDMYFGSVREKVFKNGK
ncbi:hypothetical protein B0H13DRAFT_2683738 [Mycena leptocephala]|nr:hypothetical protein B0H13DRAFT_2683738 [Mycena leptocephala]